ncbi:9345_t:CDS:2 [Acaulospora colombiana]|uniref:9345_t:CDS:1 n=1 Tax=Acaulospora colombiana TaxID=27376 RepID=A0ACA9LAG9_9GLOM|nr:9345_t:CDS:2 [Acaulospora colombiana]
MEEIFDHESLNEEELNGEMTDAGYENDEDEGDLDMKDIGEEAWLVKVLPILYGGSNLMMSRWNLQEFESILNNSPSDNDLHKDLPKEYELDIIGKDVQDSYCFCQDINADTRTVKTTFNMKPSTNDVEYNKKLRERTIQASKPERTIRILGEDESRGAYVPPGGTSAAQKKAKVTMEQKTTRMPRNDLLDLLFDAFSRYMYWTFRGLKDYAKQPESYLKEILSEIAILDKKGPYNNCYHLKPEYSQKNSAAEISVAPQGLEAPIAGVGSGGEEQLEFEEDETMLDRNSDDEELFGSE